MKSLDDNESVRLSKPTGMDGENGESRSGVIGNERLTALAGAVLLVLILLELVSSANLHALLPLHIFVGVLLAGPLVVKLGSTGYRFLRYYTGSPAFVRKGPPRLALRVLSPLILAATLAGVGVAASRSTSTSSSRATSARYIKIRWPGCVSGRSADATSSAI